MNKEKHNEDGLTQMQAHIKKALTLLAKETQQSGTYEAKISAEQMSTDKVQINFKIDTNPYEKQLEDIEHKIKQLTEKYVLIPEEKQIFNQRLVDITYRGKCDPKTKLEDAYYDLWYYLPAESMAINWFYLDPEVRGPMNIIRTEPSHHKYKQDDYQVCTIQSVLKSLIMLRALFKEVKGYCNNSNLSNALWAAAVGISHQLDPFLVSTFEPFGTMWWMSYDFSAVSFSISDNPVYNLRGNMCYIDSSEWRFGKDFAQLHKDLMKHPVYSHWWLPMTDKLIRATPIELHNSSQDVLIDWDLFRRGFSIRANECSTHEWMNDLGKDIRSSVIDMEGKTL